MAGRGEAGRFDTPSTERFDNPSTAFSNSVGNLNSFVVGELARLPLILAPSPEDVVDLTGDSEEEVVNHQSPVNIVEHVECIDLSSPVRIVVEDIGDLERDGMGDPTRGEEVPPVAVSYSQQQPPLHHRTNLSDDDDDVILVSSYHATPVVKPKCKVTPPLMPNLNHVITCPICMETQKNFSLIGHFLVTTKCGHLFCDNCLKKSISLKHKCPTCSSKLTLRQYHRIYV